MDPFEFQSPQHHWHQYPYYQQHPFHQPMPQRRGLNQVLHKLLGKGHTPYGRLPQAPFMSGPGMSAKYAQLYETLNHVQKGLGIIQQVSPYIKQYGPFVKNLPMLVDMVKIMMENEEEELSDEHHDHHDDEDNHKEHHEDHNERENRAVEHQRKTYKKSVEDKEGVDHHEKNKRSPRSRRGDDPRPKLYI